MNKIGFVGAGKMACAMVGGIISKLNYCPKNIICTCGNDPTGETLSQETGINYTTSIKEVFDFSDIIILACKPQQLNEIDVASSDYGSGKLIISILAGINLEKLTSKFSKAKNIVRVMPNTPAQISQGVSAFCPFNELETEDAKIVSSILSSFGKIMPVKEKFLDAVTALSGSGPAYVFEFARIMIESAKKLGFNEEEAKFLSYNTLIGSSLLLEKSPLSAEELRIAVTSKAGTTEAALNVLKDMNFEQMLEKAIFAAKDRSQELSRL